MSVTRRKFIRNAGATTLGAAAVAKAESASAQQTPQPKPRKPQPKANHLRRKILTDRAPRPAGPYSQAIVSGNTVYVAGQVAIDPKTGKTVPGAFEEQAVQVFENIKAILEAAGTSPANAVKVSVFLTDLSNFQKMNDIYRRYFTEDYPVRTTVGAQLAGEYLIEVDCIAVKP
ncbi:MAG TPA: Rid family detoxifying hydrolase [Blastocatellia bacterium]|nr:Rid family detoxifying hydrolase [Blastocatellia bacterium]